MIEKETIDAYEAGLRDLEPQAVIDAVSILVKESRFMPTIAEIREVVAEQTLGLPTPGEAWGEAQARSFGTWEGERHPLVSESIKRMGGTWGIKTSENQSITQSQFLKHYRELRDEAIRYFQRTGSMPEMPDPPRPSYLVEEDDGTYRHCFGGHVPLLTPLPDDRTEDVRQLLDGLSESMPEMS